MGFKVNKQELVIKFSDEQYAGLEVAARKPTIREALEGEKLSSVSMTEKNMTKLFDYLSKFIVRWNIEDDEDKVMPINTNSFFDLPIELTAAILTGFVEGASGVSVPLESDSANGETLPVVAVQMEAL